MLRIDIKDERLTIYLGERKVIEHSADSPFIEAGKKGSYGVEKLKPGVYRLAAFRHDAQRETFTFFSGNRSVTVMFTEREENAEITFLKSSEDFGYYRLHLPVGSGRITGGGGISMRGDLRGSRLPMSGSPVRAYGSRSEQATLGELFPASKYNTAPFSIPFFKTEQNEFTAVYHDGNAAFDFRERGVLTAVFDELPKKLVVGKGERAARQASEALTGAKRRLPDWLRGGLILGISGGSELLDKAVRVFGRAGIEPSAVLIRDLGGISGRLPADGEFWDWIWNASHYPRLDEKLIALSERGIKAICYINPHFASDGMLFAEAAARGYLIRNPDGTVRLDELSGVKAGHLAALNADARKWMKGIIADNIFALGFRGIFTDSCGELPGISPVRARRAWAELLWEAAEEYGVEDFLLIGGEGSPGMSLTLASASGSGMDWSCGTGLKSSLRELISLGESGLGLAYCDFGANSLSMPAKLMREQYLRWAELSAFTPVMQTPALLHHLADLLLDDEDLLGMFAGILGVRELTEPYMAELLAQYEAGGAPPIRNTHMAEGQFMLGDELLIAPIVKNGHRHASVELPEGRWIHLITGKEYRGGRQSVPAPIGVPAVFYIKDGVHAELFGEVARQVER